MPIQTNTKTRHHQVLLGVDTGGTFTDFVFWNDGKLSLHKCLSTPDAPERAILQGIQELGLDPATVGLIHGSTVATNAVLEGKGVRTAYVTNRGMADLLTIGRQARDQLYALEPASRRPPVPPELCIETGGRRGADASLIEPLTDDDLSGIRQRLEQVAPAAVAINLLFSYLNDAEEKRLAQAVPEGIFVSRASDILPLQGEYERGIATWLNAWIGPIVAGYLGRLQQELPGAWIRVMQSSGEALAADQSAKAGVRLLLSGPAGGLVATRAIGAAAGLTQLMSVDMGGTSTDVALIDGEPRLTTRNRIGPYPVALPMVDLHTIGAGGGSIARIDPGGLLLVGPESAGAAPGPICYNRGGREVTVTDANLVLGRLRADAFLGGRMPLNTKAAHQGLTELGSRMGMSAEEAALGVIAVANEHMAGALRVISVQRGIDPKGFTLCAFGGAGGLHVCALADALGMDAALAPAQSGVLSALGMLVAPPGRLLTRAWLQPLHACSDQDLNAGLDKLARRATEALSDEGIDPRTLTRETSIDLRYQGQSTTLNLPWTGCSRLAMEFPLAHHKRYGHELEQPIEIVNLRVRVTAPAPTLDMSIGAPPLRATPSASQRRQVYGHKEGATVLARTEMSIGQRLEGPAIVLDPVATTWIEPEWSATLDAMGNVRLRKEAGC